MNKLISVSCPICSTNDSALYKKIKDFSVSQETFDVVRCKKCDFLYTNPRPSEEFLDHYYKSENYISHTNKANNLVNLLYTFARTQNLKWKFNLINKDKPSSLLDYGCGTGHFLEHSKKRGLKVSGFEPNSDARKIACDDLNLSVFSSTSSIENVFDTITLWHVLEHIPNLDDVMIWLKDHLKKQGSLVIAIPNVESYDSSLFKEYWAAYDIPRHLSHFTKKSLTDLATKHSFKVVSIYPMFLDAFYISLLSNKNKNNFIKPISSFVSGLRSNVYGKKDMNYSSLVYLLKHNNV